MIGFTNFLYKSLKNLTFLIKLDLQKRSFSCCMFRSTKILGSRNKMFEFFVCHLFRFRRASTNWPLSSLMQRLFLDGEAHFCISSMLTFYILLGEEHGRFWGVMRSFLPLHRGWWHSHQSRGIPLMDIIQPTETRNLSRLHLKSAILQATEHQYLGSAKF